MHEADQVANSLCLHRNWLYWSSSIAGATILLVLGFFTRETSASALFRARIASLRYRRNGWTPEPRAEARLRQLPRHLLRPYQVLFSHWIVAISTLIAAVFAGSLASAYGGLVDVLISTHDFTRGWANFTLTACGAVGGVAAFALLPLFSGPSETKAAKRPLHLDESGLIGWNATALLPERVLKAVVFAAPAAALGE